MSANLTFKQLNKANIDRCESSFHPVDGWSPTDWATAVAGEVGEACNLIKKLRRGEDVSLYEIGDELADAVIYIDLLCHRLGLSLSERVVKKFNEVSVRVGSEEWL